ncbi:MULTISPECIES: hypothetical protein [Streptomyces]|nr:hypothetical protein [Streptomyces longispororuber]
MRRLARGAGRIATALLTAALVVFVYLMVLTRGSWPPWSSL